MKATDRTAALTAELPGLPKIKPREGLYLFLRRNLDTATQHMRGPLFT